MGLSLGLTLVISSTSLGFPRFARKIFDADQSRWRRCGLHFKHTDNIVHFMNAAKHIGLPPIFLPETTDIYDCKNMPR